MTKELHEGHPGVTHMKALARSFVYLEEPVKIVRALEIYHQLLPCNPGSSHRSRGHEFMQTMLDLF